MKKKKTWCEQKIKINEGGGGGTANSKRRLCFGGGETRWTRKRGAMEWASKKRKQSNAGDARKRDWAPTERKSFETEGQENSKEKEGKMYAGTEGCRKKEKKEGPARCRWRKKGTALEDVGGEKNQD